MHHRRLITILHLHSSNNKSIQLLKRKQLSKPCLCLELTRAQRDNLLKKYLKCSREATVMWMMRIQKLRTLSKKYLKLSKHWSNYRTSCAK